MHKILVVLFLFVQVISAQEVIDEIVAVVDNEIILQSEVDFQVNLTAAKSNLDPKDPALRSKIINGMIEEKLLYAQAELDSITVSDDQVEQQLDYLINYYTQQYGSRERLEQAYGMNIDRIKREMRSDTRKNLMSQMVQSEKFGTIEATRREVRNFFETYEDSLGTIPEKFTLAHIFINPKTNTRLKQIAFQLAQSLLDSIKNGADFAELAKVYSKDPGSAAEGGDLGFVKRGVFFPEFESVAFALKPGELSKVVESPVGYHIIELLERRGESIHTRHILIKPKIDDAADLNTIEKLTEIRDSIVAGVNTFTYYANKYSDDQQTATFGGELGTFEAGQLDKSLLDQVYKLKEGEIGFPKRLEVDKDNYGYHIVKLVKRTPEHRPGLETDYDEIKQLTELKKKQDLYKEWMAELKEKIFWETKL